MKVYFTGGSKLRFDFSDIRPKGARLVTSGGKAPGPQPLKECILKVGGILEQKEVKKVRTQNSKLNEFYTPPDIAKEAVGYSRILKNPDKYTAMAKWLSKKQVDRLGKSFYYSGLVTS